MTTCTQSVFSHTTRVRGFHAYKSCEKSVVFTDKEGKPWCALHAKGREGYVPAPKPDHRSWRVFYIENGKKSWQYIWDSVSERGVRIQVKRRFPAREIVGIVPNMADSEFDVSPLAKEWAAFI